MSSETRVLVVSTVAALMLGVIALVVALATGSAAILLDGAFNLCFFVTALVTLRVAQLLQLPDDRRYPFGYVQFEPLINMLKGLLILGVNLVALIDALFTIVRGGSAVSAGLALAYAGFGVVCCAAAVLFLRRAAGRIASPLIQGDVENWTVNLAISIGMLVAFSLALVLQRAEMDLILVALVVILTAAVPVRMAGRSLSALLKRSPDEAVVASVEDLARGALRDLPRRALFVRVLRPGRTTYALVHVLLDSTESGLDVRRADELRRSVVAAVTSRHAPAIVDIVFTTVDEFAAPTTGFPLQPSAA
jgi:cation diffusion facilitator family transporter